MDHQALRPDQPPTCTNAQPCQLADAKRGERVDLSAEAPAPDGDTVSYEWFYYSEAGTFTMATPRSGIPFGIDNFD